MLLVKLLASAPTRLQRLLVVLVACLLAKRRLAADRLRPVDLLAPGQRLLANTGTVLMILVRLLLIMVRLLLIQAWLLLFRGRFRLILRLRRRH